MIDIPFYYIRKYTIMSGDEEDYNHHYTKYWPFLGIFFIIVNIYKTVNLYYLFALPLIFIMYKYFSYYKKDEIPHYFLYLTLLSILGGILWTKICCGLLVDLLTVIGIQTNLSTTYLGLTVLAVGNALPDGLTTISIAKKG